MEAYHLRYKMRQLTGRIWYWTRQALIVAALLGAAILAWTWQDRTAERVTAQSQQAVHVIDGDSLTIGGTGGGTARAGQSLRTIRIQGIDAPEYRQTCREPNGLAWDCGKEARRALDTIVKAGGLTCAVAASDRYHRTIGTCSVTGNSDIGREMVRRGMAVSGAERSDSSWYDGGPYDAEESEAQRARRGIWRGTFDRPADWRATVKTGETAAITAANDR